MYEEEPQTPVGDISTWDFQTLLSQAESGNADAQHYLGDLYDCEPDGAADAVLWWRRAAAQGHADAMSDLGTAYEGGSGVERDIDKAIVL